MVQTQIPKAAPGSYNCIAAQYARGKASKDAEDAARVQGLMGQLNRKPKTAVEKLNERREEKFKEDWAWVIGFFVWLL
jgi:phosphatidylinositol glycan class O